MPYLCNHLLLLRRIQLVGRILSRVGNFLVCRGLAFLTLFLLLAGSLLLVARPSVPVFWAVIDLIEAGAADFWNTNIGGVISRLFATTQLLAVAAVYF